jgi:hypothetical protein
MQVSLTMRIPLVFKQLNSNELQVKDRRLRMNKKVIIMLFVLLAFVLQNAHSSVLGRVTKLLTEVQPE